MTEHEMHLAFEKALQNGDIHEARYYRNLLDAISFDVAARNYNPAEFGGWNHAKS